MPVESSASEDESGSRGGAGAYRDFLAEREEILRHKWVLSEREGQDTGFEAALMDWVDHHRAQWRRQRARRGGD